MPELLGTRFSERALKEGERLNYIPAFRLLLTVFYSFADVAAFLGPRLSQVIAGRLKAGKCLRVEMNGWVWLPHVIRETLDDGTIQERQLVVSIKDLFGIDYESLRSTAAAYNVHMPDKDIMDEYKLCMDKAYLERPDEMIKYALGDLILGELWEAYERNYEQLCELFGIKAVFPIPGTKGSFVAKLFSEVLSSRLNLPEDFHKIFDIGRDSRCKSAPSVNDLMCLYGCSALANGDREITRRYLALVHGGRVKNENPWKVLHRGLVMSMDLVSCYGKALQEASLPLGHPSMFYYPKHRPAEWPALGEFLKEYRHEMCVGTWYLVVETIEPLSFPQNILFSKIFTSDNPEIVAGSKDAGDFKEDLAHIKGEFSLLENEVINGILTHYSLSIIEHCASNNELGELMSKLRVKAGMVYTKNQKIEYKGAETVSDWLEKVRSGSGLLKTKCSSVMHYTEDSRVGP